MKQTKMIICICSFCWLVNRGSTYANNSDDKIYKERNVYVQKLQEQIERNKMLAKSLKEATNDNEQLTKKVNQLQKEVDCLREKGQTLTEQLCNANRLLISYKMHPNAGPDIDPHIKEKVYESSQKLEEITQALVTSNFENKKYIRVVDRLVDSIRLALMEDQKEKEFLKEQILDYKKTAEELEGKIKSLQEQAERVGASEESLILDTLSKVPPLKELAGELHQKSQQTLTSGIISHEEQLRQNFNKQLELNESLNNEVKELKSLYASKLMSLELQIEQLKKRLLEISD